jgi:hypothetical protein
MVSEGYDVAQVCQNGHVTNSTFEDHPQFNQDCAATISNVHGGTSTTGRRIGVV